jgi:hypothetical protein
MHSSQQPKVFVCLALLIFSFFAVADERNGFRALSGSQAHNFKVPGDMVLLSRSFENAEIRERYQQFSKRKFLFSAHKSRSGKKPTMTGKPYQSLDEKGTLTNRRALASATGSS